MLKILSQVLVLSLLLFSFFTLGDESLAVVDPTVSQNNRYGIHIISATVNEASDAAQLVNSSGGDWGYITVLIESKDRDHNKWQNFFNELRRRHLIPIVRLATQPEGSVWKIPYEGEEQAWADFLDKLIWPVKNRYIVIYNEPNQGQEWAGTVNPESYAQVLNKTIDALKAKNPDFFVLNAGFDASAPQKPPRYLDEVTFLNRMNEEVPGIFNKLDGWVSHSYPNPGFVGYPSDKGRGTVRTWIWELNILRSLGLTKNLPVFITEAGWKHAEGKNYDKSLPSSEVVGKYFIESYNSAWNSNQIVAVTPFLLDYQDEPFDHFSFKKITGKSQDNKILGVSFPEYYHHYMDIFLMQKSAGKPVQDNIAKLTHGEIYHSLASNERYVIPLTFTNIGQSIWNDTEQLDLRAIKGNSDFHVQITKLPKDKKIEPGQSVTLFVAVEAPKPGDYPLSLQLFHGESAFKSPPLDYNILVKSPALIQIKSFLPFQKNPSGSYILEAQSPFNENRSIITLNSEGQSDILENKYLLPDQEYKFTLLRMFYKPKTIIQTVTSGINELNFGELQPDFLSAILNPSELWKLLPFSK